MPSGNSSLRLGFAYFVVVGVAADAGHVRRDVVRSMPAALRNTDATQWTTLSSTRAKVAPWFSK